MKKFIVIASLFASAACQQNTPPTANQTTKPNVAIVTNAAVGNGNSANAASPVSTANTPDKTKIKTFGGKGIVTKINLELGSIALDHEEIKGLMPAMEGMEFYVSDKKMLDNLKVGDKVDFVLEDDAGAERIVGIKKKLTMPKINFCKFHGFGNDYIVFEAKDLSAVSSIENFARAVCHRHTGIGGDGIAILEKLAGGAADYSCRIVNPDGSEAGFSGNGTRCAVAYLYHKNLWSSESLKLETKSGIKTYELLERNDSTFGLRAELGKPNFDLPKAPLSEAILSETNEAKNNHQGFSLLLPREGIVIGFTFVDVGNPAAVIFLKDFDEIDWRKLGSQIENFTSVFPERTNVVFVKIVDRENIEIRIWERGAGETSSSGTCSIAAAVASAYTEKTERKVSVRAPGGTTEAVWREGDDEMLITGRADLAFCGEWFERI